MYLFLGDKWICSLNCIFKYCIVGVWKYNWVLYILFLNIGKHILILVALMLHMMLALTSYHLCSCDAFSVPLLQITIWNYLGSRMHEKEKRQTFSSTSQELLWVSVAHGGGSCSLIALEAVLYLILERKVSFILWEVFSGRLGLLD